VRELLRRTLKPAHDRLFERWVYRVEGGYLDGYLRRGRMPWFQARELGPRQAAELRWLEGRELRGAVVYDVGANLGTHTFLFHRLAGEGGEVHAFEPDPAMLPALLDTARLNGLGNVEVHPVALGSAPSVAELVVPDARRVRMSATLDPALGAKASGALRARTARVRVVRLDDYREALGLPPPRFVKIDVEGFELEVLRGAASTLAAARPELFVEVHGADRAAQVAMMRALLALLEPLGYRASHLESGAALSAGAAELPAGGHLLARCDR
jgi:FkbM family methyltransferase